MPEIKKKVTPRETFKVFPSVSPYVKANGPLYFNKTHENSIELGFLVQEKHTNLPGVCHGGVLVMLLDSAMAVEVIYKVAPEKITPTISLTCNFLHPAKLGQFLVIRSEVVRSTKRHAFVRCIISHDEELIASAEAVYLLPERNTLGFNLKKIIDEVSFYS